MLIQNVVIVNEGRSFAGGLLIEGEIIVAVLEGDALRQALLQYQGGRFGWGGGYLMPGLIDDQVHFREPGLTHKGDLSTESRAAAAGGITSFMEMPNTQPQTLTQGLLEEKYALAAERSAVNYSFYMGASNDNLEEVKKTDPTRVCGVKVFMGASTGNMLVDNPSTLQGIFAESPCLVAVHSEDEGIIRRNMELYSLRDDVSSHHHSLIRSREACIRSTEKAMALAARNNTRLHVLHVSTAEEALMMTEGPVRGKRITAEACVHHLWFSSEDYALKGNWIKWNPSIKDPKDRTEIRNALKNNRLDIVATDHAPHTIEEKSRPYLQAPSGGPLVQHSLLVMLELALLGEWSVEFVVNKMCHAPADLFRIRDRGYIREGYKADLVLAAKTSPWSVTPDQLLYKCKWSPFDGVSFQHRVAATWVNGVMVYDGRVVRDDVYGQRLLFDSV